MALFCLFSGNPEAAAPNHVTSKNQQQNGAAVDAPPEFKTIKWKKAEQVMPLVKSLLGKSKCIPKPDKCLNSIEALFKDYNNEIVISNECYTKMKNIISFQTLFYPCNDFKRILKVYNSDVCKRDTYIKTKHCMMYDTT